MEGIKSRKLDFPNEQHGKWWMGFGVVKFSVFANFFSSVCTGWWVVQDSDSVSFYNLYLVLHRKIVLKRLVVFLFYNEIILRIVSSSLRLVFCSGWLLLVCRLSKLNFHLCVDLFYIGWSFNRKVISLELCTFMYTHYSLCTQCFPLLLFLLFFPL